MGDTTPSSQDLNRAGRRAEARMARIRKAGAVAAAFPTALGTTALLLGASATPAGAFELTVTNLDKDGAGSLHDVAEGANDGDVIVFQAGLTGTIPLDDDIDIDTSIEIQGPGAGVVTVSGGNAVRVFNLSSPGTETITIAGLTVTAGKAGFGAGLTVSDDTTLTLLDMVFTANSSTGGGGAIGLDNSDVDLHIENTSISGNTATNWGGGIYFYSGDGSITVVDSTLSGNLAGSGGGAAWLGGDGASTVITTSTVSDNTTTTREGGGLGLYTDSVHISGSTISGNSSGSGGGGFYVGGNDGDVLIEGSVISGNTSQNGGGGIYLWSGDGTVTIRNTTVSGNTARHSGGGGIYVGSSEYAGGVTILDSTISGNVAADGWGGGLYVAYHDGSVQVYNSTISGNTASEEGGGIAIWDGSGVYLTQVTLTDNAATSFGGIYLGAVRDVAVKSKTLEAETRAGDPEGERGPRVKEPRSPRAQTVFDQSSVFLLGTIVAGNSGTDIGPAGEIRATSSLVGTMATPGTTFVDQGGNLLGVDPLLGPLADNGGPTQTHELLPGSQAINAGPNPVATFPGNEFNPRGDSYARVVAGIVDIGAFEVQPPPELEPTFTG